MLFRLHPVEKNSSLSRLGIANFSRRNSGQPLFGKPLGPATKCGLLALFKSSKSGRNQEFSWFLPLKQYVEFLKIYFATGPSSHEVESTGNITCMDPGKS